MSHTKDKKNLMTVKFNFYSIVICPKEKGLHLLNSLALAESVTWKLSRLLQLSTSRGVGLGFVGSLHFFSVVRVCEDIKISAAYMNISRKLTWYCNPKSVAIKFCHNPDV